ncbi:hypothetical protein QFC20_004315 [Naganishia adeliensis]|uniref:Uncharacterized protein n=1 Tax=Naganishia adeliensis TaxID=92952 RepID=A0ACC2W2U7_9TREE|nr:hypothetical protein QFC20_004315 [Naganishia adeliensis]
MSLAETPSYSLAKRSSSSKSTKESAGGAAEEIINFMQVIMEGGIHWVTLVNATQSDLGSCLGLSTFSTLVVQGSNGSFATAVNDYLADMCGGTKCDSTTMKYWKYKIEKDCSAGNDLKQPLLRDVGGATAPRRTICTGCMHEIYKAAMFLIPSIRGWNEVIGLGGVLATCPGTDLAWNDICDMQKPAALSVEAAATTGTGSRSAAFSIKVDRLLYGALVVFATICLLQ